MRQKTKQEDLMVRYLFGELTEEEQNEIEEQFLADNQYFEQLCSVEDALIDDYVQDLLTEYERKKVEELLRSSPRQSREIDFVRDLIDSVSEKDTAEVKRAGKLKSLLARLRIGNPWKRFSLAVAVLLIAIALYVSIWNLALQKRVEQMEAKQAVLEKREQELRQRMDEQADDRKEIFRELESERRRREQLEEEMAALQESNPLIARNDFVTIDLNLDSVSRGGDELKTARIPPGIAQIRIRISLDKEDKYKSYGAVIKTFDGREVWSKDQIGAGPSKAGRLIFTLPARVIANDDYTLTLKGRTEDGSIVEIRDYSFRARK